MRKRALFAATLAALSLCACAGNESVTTTVADTTAQTVETTVAPTTEEIKETTEAPTEEVAELGTIKELFSQHGMKAGTCLTAQMIGNQKAEKLILENYNSVTMENDMKPDYIFDKDKSVSTGEITIQLNSNAIKMLDWAKANDMSVRGHTLIWYSQTPEWIFHEDFDVTKGLVDRDTMLGRMEGIIKGTFDKLTELGYIDLFYAYDVVNEAWMENGSMRDNHWKEIIGEDYLWHAFNFANTYAPESVDLYYNDYNEQYKVSTLDKFVKTLVDEDGNYLIDGIGLQAHLYTGDDIVAYLGVLDKLSNLGLKIQLTELDVCLGSWKEALPATEANLVMQGKYYYSLIKGILERVDAGTLNLDALTFWGVTDMWSWRKDSSPLLFNYKFEPKPALYGVLQNLDLIQ